MGKYFCGHYFKLQSNNETIALIPSYSKVGKDYKAYLQIISKDGSFLIEYPYYTYKKGKGFNVKIGNNEFNENGIKLNINEEHIKLNGEIKFGPLNKLKHNIMGPFKFVPFMQCIHSVCSIRHEINGKLILNDKEYNFNNSYGYIEGDRGRSFPKVYSWTQALFNDATIMLSVADIPFGLFHFTGIIGFINYNNKTKIIGTYNFAKAKRIKDGEIIIKQGSYKLTIKLIKRKEYPLAAPNLGSMERTIKESAECVAYYKLERKNEVLFERTTNNASFEYEYINKYEKE